MFCLGSLQNYATPEQLFYHLHSGYYAYVPKIENAKGQALQARNSLIGQFTEKWTKDIFTPIARSLGFYAINGVECEKIGLSRRSAADLAFCTTNSKKQVPENVKLIFEIKMSVASNYKYESGKIKFIGDYKTHKGNPFLLRSDSMLKAIGKSINIRVSGISSSNIPIIVIGNSPITENYSHKVDFLKNSGVVQGFWSLNPRPTSISFIEKTDGNGFLTIKNLSLLKQQTKEVLEDKLNYFSSMIPKKKLGEFINISSKESYDEQKAEKFLNLIRGLV